MKALTLILTFTLMGAGALVGQTTTLTTTTGTGTIAHYEPGTKFVVKESSGPVDYRYGPTVEYVTKSGRIITKSRLKSRVAVGRPVTVHYVTKGGRRVVNRVIMDDKDDDDDDDDDDGK